MPLIPVAVIRYEVIGGLGGYSGDPVGPRRLVGSAVSYAVAAITPHELRVLQRPWLLVVPALVLAAAGLGLRRLAPTEPRLFAVACLGLAWFTVGVLPVLGEPLDLNTASGERLLLLPSVGLSLFVGAVVCPHLDRKQVRATGVTACCVMAALCVNGSRNWLVASDLAERAVSSAARLAPRQGTLVLLSFPASYRNARPAVPLDLRAV